MFLRVATVEDIDRYLDQLHASARATMQWLATQSADPLDIFRRLKFEECGRHPIEDRPLNIIEQINQTWTYAVALLAARKLIELHPEAGGFRLAPGADADIALDIMSEAKRLVGAETFAAVSPSNNDKLTKDLNKMAGRPERHRYVFFMSPQFPQTGRLRQFERGGVQVWSVVL